MKFTVSEARASPVDPGALKPGLALNPEVGSDDSYSSGKDYEIIVGLKPDLKMVSFSSNVFLCVLKFLFSAFTSTSNT